MTDKQNEDRKGPDDSALAPTLGAGAEARDSDYFTAAPLSLPVVSRERYGVLEALAQGGIGRILRATDERLRRLVALKELLDPSPEAEERFVREALVTAKLQHPAIVPIYDAGRFPTGEAFYAMKLVQGRSLEVVIDEAKTFDRRLALLPHVIAVAEAIAYAHSERIVHRDLKPANVLVGAFGETVVIDWGIAKDLGKDPRKSATGKQEIDANAEKSVSEDGRMLTMKGAIIGTPAYMPPEQAAGDAVDERADVYALGAILYHTLAGAPPYAGKSGLDIVSQVLTREPVPLSAKQKGVPRDLLAVVSKAMARSPQDRYPTANELAQDLRRFQTGQIVRAHHYSKRERAIRFVQKYKTVLAVAAVAFVVSASIAGASLYRVVEARTVAEQERDRANEERTRAEKKQVEAEEARTNTMKRSDELILLEARAAARRDPNEAVAWLGDLCGAFGRWGEARLIAAEADAYGIAKILRAHQGPVSHVQYSPDGKLIATASDDKTIGIWSADGKLQKRLTGHQDEVWRLAFASDSLTLASGSKDGTARVWNVETGESEVFQTKGPEAYWVNFVKNESAVAFVNCSEKRIDIRDRKTGERELVPVELSCPADFSTSRNGKDIVIPSKGNVAIYDSFEKSIQWIKPEGGQCLWTNATKDGKFVACSGQFGFVSLWETTTGRRIKLPGQESSSIASDWRAFKFSPDGKLFAWSVARGSVTVLDLESGAPIAVFRDQNGNIINLAFSGDSRWIASVGSDHTASLREIHGAGHRLFHGFGDATSWVDFSPDHMHLVVSSWDHTARIFPVGESRDRVIRRGKKPILFGGFSADGARLLSSEGEAILRSDPIAWTEGTKGGTERKLGTAASLIVSSLDRSSLAFADEKGKITVRDAEAEHDTRALESLDGPIRALTISSQKDKVAALSQKGHVRLWDLASGSSTLLEKGEDARILMFSPAGDSVAVAGMKGTILVFSGEDANPKRLEGHEGEVFTLAFTRDGKSLVSGGYDHRIRIWDLENGSVRAIDASGLGVQSILLSADEKSIFSLGSEPGIRHWDFQTGKLIQMLRNHETPVDRIAVSPDNTRLVSASQEGMLLLWDLESGQSRRLEGHQGRVSFLSFSPDGQQIASAGADGTLRIWYDDLPMKADGIRAWMTSVMPAQKGPFASREER